MHGHHFGIYPHTILMIRVQMGWQLYKGQRRLTVRVEVFFQRVSAEVYIALVYIGHFFGRIDHLVETHLVQDIDADSRVALLHEFEEQPSGVMKADMKEENPGSLWAIIRNKFI